MGALSEVFFNFWGPEAMTDLEKYLSLSKSGNNGI